MVTKRFAIDAAPGLIKRETAQAAVTTTGYVGLQHDQGGRAVTDLVAVINIEAVKVSAANEGYIFRLVGSNAADRSDAQVLGMAQLGHASQMGPDTRNSAAGDQVVVRGRSEKGNTFFRFLDLHLTVSGTAPSIQFGAYLTKEF